jgi:hypothetical protein
VIDGMRTWQIFNLPGAGSRPKKLEVQSPEPATVFCVHLLSAPKRKVLALFSKKLCPSLTSVRQARASACSREAASPTSVLLPPHAPRAVHAAITGASRVLSFSVVFIGLQEVG